MTAITADQRTVLTWVFLLILGYGVYRIFHAAVMSSFVYNRLPRAKREVRGPIQMAKWMLGVHMIFLWLVIQNLVDPDDLPTLRGIFFTGAVITAVLIAIFLDRGYSRYWDDLKPLDRILARGKRIDDPEEEAS